MWCLLLPCSCLGVAIWKHHLQSNLSFMRITSSAVLSVPILVLLRRGSLLSLLRLSVRMSLLESVFSLAPPKLSRGPRSSGIFLVMVKVWKVQLGIRDLGEHLDFTKRARAGTLSSRVRVLLLVLLLLVPYLWGFQSNWDQSGESISLMVFMLLRLLMYPPPFLVLLGRAIVNTPAILSLLDGPEGLILLFILSGLGSV